jgi:magnesium transporter
VVAAYPWHPLARLARVSAAILFDGTEVQRLASLEERPRRLAGARLLWIDLDTASRADAAAEVADLFELDAGTQRALESPGTRAVFEDHGDYIHVTAYAPRDDEPGEFHGIECVVGENWVITAHDLPIPVLDEFAERVSGSGNTGSLDGPTFLAALLEWVLGAYSSEFQRIEHELEEFDVEAMRGERSDADIEILIELRRKLGSLRRALAAHRSPLVALTYPELDALGDREAARRFENVLSRFEAALQESRDARTAIVGSFDVLIARDGHHTNEIMKVLTLVSVILLPGALIAGVMGMNFKVGLFDDPSMFWVVVALIVALAPLTIAVAKFRDWI